MNITLKTKSLLATPAARAVARFIGVCEAVFGTTNPTFLGNQIGAERAAKDICDNQMKAERVAEDNWNIPYPDSCDFPPGFDAIRAKW